MENGLIEVVLGSFLWICFLNWMAFKGNNKLVQPSSFISHKGITGNEEKKEVKAWNLEEEEWGKNRNSKKMEKHICYWV